jgi:hypothetical protein
VGKEGNAFISFAALIQTVIHSPAALVKSGQDKFSWRSPPPVRPSSVASVSRERTRAAADMSRTPAKTSARGKASVLSLEKLHLTR